MSDVQGILSKKEDGTFEYKVINEWQLCPKCNGTGAMSIMWPGYVINTEAPCDLCCGKKIISKVTGIPPA